MHDRALGALHIALCQRVVSSRERLTQVPFPIFPSQTWDDDTVNDPIGQQLRAQVTQHLAAAQHQQPQQQQEEGK